MSNRLLTIAGNIGAGKTSLAQALAEELGAHLAQERFSDNPFLAKAYADPQRWGMHSQLWFILSFGQTGQDLVNYPGIAIQDRSLPEAFEVFTRLYHDNGNISDDEIHLLEIVYNQSMQHIRNPDLLILLDTPPNLCRERIQERGREAEQEINVKFLERVEKRLALFVESWPGQVVRLDGKPDLREREHFATALEQIRQSL